MALNRGAQTLPPGPLGFQSEYASSEAADPSEGLVRNRANLLLWELILAVELTVASPGLPLACNRLLILQVLVERV